MHAIGILETNILARGVLAADAMAKAAEIKLLQATPMCPGKYLIIIKGTVASVKSSLEAGITVAGESLIGSELIPNVHQEVFPAIAGTSFVGEVGAIGMIETFSAPSAVIAADEAVKTAKIQLVEIRLHRALGGKAFVIFTGEVSAVRAGISAGVRRVKEQALVLSTALIPAPHKDLIDRIL
ncbi:MAG: BMC domain-containing protein [Candidatus Hodarchaeales archaeon]|jgi:microcompartment protein CcmL/EutN